MQRRANLGSLAALLLTGLVACGDDSPGLLETEVDVATEASIRLVSGDNQQGLQRTLLPEPIVIRVGGRLGVALEGVRLRTSVTMGDGEILAGEHVTGADGQFEIQWHLGEAYDQEAVISIEERPSESVVVHAVAEYRYEVPESVDDGWPTRSLNLDEQATQSIFQGIDEIRKGTYPEIHSLLITKGGDLVFEAYFPGHDSQGRHIEWDRETPHEVQSASKSFRSMLIGIAIDRGFIPGVDATLPTLLTDYAEVLTGDKQHITLEHVLTMSSGLDWNEWAYPFADSRNTLSTMYSRPATSWAGFVLERPLAHEPGTQWVYNTGASIMLNQILIAASGMQLLTFVRTYYSSLVESSRVPGVGYPLGATTIPRDMAKFGQVYLDRGMWKELRVLSEEWVDASLTPRFRIDARRQYGYQWWMRTLRTTRAAYPVSFASGNGGQFVYVIRELDLVVVATGGNFGSATMQQVHPFLEAYVLPAFE